MYYVHQSQRVVDYGGWAPTGVVSYPENVWTCIYYISYCYVLWYVFTSGPYGRCPTLRVGLVHAGGLHVLRWGTCTGCTDQQRTPNLPTNITPANIA